MSPTVHGAGEGNKSQISLFMYHYSPGGAYPGPQSGTELYESFFLSSLLKNYLICNKAFLKIKVIVKIICGRTLLTMKAFRVLLSQFSSGFYEILQPFVSIHLTCNTILRINRNEINGLL